MPFDSFEWAFKLVVGLEGGFTRDSKDPGNWTGGAITKGELKGTKYGISAASYPNLDIQNLTLEQAKAIYRSDYWLAAHCDRLTLRLSVLVFDSAVQHGVATAVGWLATPCEFETYLARRLLYYASLGDFPTFGDGWMRRVGNLMLHMADNPDTVDTLVFNGPRFPAALSIFSRGRLDGGFAFRERPSTTGQGGKIDLRPA